MAERYDEQYRDRGQRRETGDRGFMERAGDEVRSWFGDDDAERRRHMDEPNREREGFRERWLGQNTEQNRGESYRGQDRGPDYRHQDYRNQDYRGQDYRGQQDYGGQQEHRGRENRWQSSLGDDYGRSRSGGSGFRGVSEYGSQSGSQSGS